MIKLHFILLAVRSKYLLSIARETLTWLVFIHLYLLLEIWNRRLKFASALK